ncbi:hypothetical protein ONZ43_g5245 [Nemania bipapillata]|uniref:Uncharacterized protein n=1 Tax=Nemania bipapillata TaxID=110536 RepID=A0ACC2ID06_9PEZI|nr:hypothetical protein ONZ43_g5245 [Nemania bipapillata]
MLAARDQENLTASHQHGAAIKQQQGQTRAQFGPKTPGAKFSKTPLKVPLNDENGAHAMTSKVFKGSDKSNFVTPMGELSLRTLSGDLFAYYPTAQRARAVLGDKTTNAKAKGLQTVNVKSAIREIEQSQAGLQNTARPRQREPQAETQKLQVHAEEADPLSEDEVEYCPPSLKPLPYESDVFPDGILKFDALKPENLMRGYYQYYFNPIDEDGVSKRDRELQEATRKAIEEGERRIKQDLDNFEWSVKAELESETKAVKKAYTSSKLPAPEKPLSTIRSRNAANVLSIDDTTKSMRRRAAKTSELGKPLHKKSSSFAIPILRSSKPGSSQLSSIPKRSATELDATSRATIGYNKGRATAPLLTKTATLTQLTEATLPSAPATTRRGGLPRSNTTLSNDSDKTITPARYAHRQASAAVAAGEDEEQVWRGRVPFLSIFNPDEGVDEDEDDDPLCIKNKASSFLDGDDEEEFELKLAD